MSGTTMAADVGALHALGQLSINPARVAELSASLEHHSRSIAEAGSTLSSAQGAAASSFGSAGPSLFEFLHTCGLSFAGQASGLEGTSLSIREFAATVQTQDSHAITPSGAMQ